MSVRKGDRKEGKLQVLNKARELKRYSLGLVKNEKHFPKSTRWLYASPIANEIREACVCIHHYFQSISHEVAKAAIYKRVTDKQIADRACEIVDSFGECGLGLGSQVSQLVALAVLDDLDHYIKERLCVKHYIRYMDDFILVHHDKAFLQRCRAEIEERLNAIGLQLNGKTALYPLRQGVKLLQWRFIVTDTGAIIRKMAKKKQGKQRRKLKKLYAKELSGEYAPGTAHESLVSFLANAARGDTYHERRKMIKFYNELEANSNEKRLVQTPCESRGNG